MINKDRFKFRIFDKDKNKMYYEDKQIDFEYILSQEHLILMQCVGTLDIGKNLIYEGDILWYTGLPKELSKFIICFENEKFIKKNIRQIDTAYRNNKLDSFEIIGNIYENSELLNKIN